MEDKILRISLTEALAYADMRRADLVKKLCAEDTDAWRMFNGSVEGRPGLTIDRYGSYLLVMIFWNALTEDEITALHEYADSKKLSLIIWERQDKKRSIVRHIDRCEAEKGLPSLAQGKDWSLDALCHEQGQIFGIAPVSHGKDPYLFLDFRAGRRWLRNNVQSNQRVLNLFSYTCSAGIAAASSGATVINVDFSRWCLDIGRHNSSLNGISSKRFKIWQEDVFPIIRQLSGLGVKGRASQRHFMRVEPQKFDVIILDPPTLASSPFGKVDLKCDYASMLKPCLLCLNEGGCILATNHHSDVTWNEWVSTLMRTATKINMKPPKIERLYPEDDFPTLDGEQPLKIAIIKIA